MRGYSLAQKNKRVFIVVGAESTGTRLLSEILISAGCQCKHSDGWHWQQWDYELPKDDTLVYHRSFPHGGQWYSMSEIFRRFTGYQFFVVVMVRDWHSVSYSQARFQEFKAIAPNIQRAYIDIFAGLKNIPYEIVSYEALQSEDYIRAFLERLHLDHHCQLPAIRDENGKYYAF